MLKPLLSLCMIVKDEEDNLPRCLASVVDVVEEIIIVDTGSKDGTLEIAKKFNAKVYHLAWQDDFSTPRNLSIDMASGQWILILDADEELLLQDKDKVRASLLNEKAEGFNWRIKNVYSDNPPSFELGLTFRVFRNRPHYRYIGSIHEQMASVILNHSPSAIIVSEDITVIHHGYKSEQVNKKKKKARNLRILQKEQGAATKSLYPNNNFFHFNMGMEYFRLHKFRKAYYHFSEAEKDLPQSSAFAPKLARYITACLVHLRQLIKALNYVQGAIRNYPKFLDLYFDRALIYVSLGQYSKAIEDFCFCLDTTEVPECFFPQNGLNGFRAYYHLGMIFEKLQDYQQALLAYKSALRLEPNYSTALERIVSLLVQSGLSEEQIEEELKSHFSFNDTKALFLLWNIFFSIGFYEKALHLLKEISSLPNYPNLEYYQGITLIRLKRNQEALVCLDKVPQGSPNFAAAQVNKCFCYWITNDLLASAKLIPKIKKAKINPYLKTIYPNFQDLLSGKNPDPPKIAKAKEAYYHHSVLDLVEGFVIIGQIDKAMLAGQLALPQASAFVLTNTLKVLVKHGYHQKVLKLLPNTNQISPEDRILLEAEIAEKNQDYYKAKNLYKNAISLNPTNEDSYLKAAYCLEKESIAILIALTKRG